MTFFFLMMFLGHKKIKFKSNFLRAVIKESRYQFFSFLKREKYFNKYMLVPTNVSIYTSILHTKLAINLFKH